MDTKGRPNLVEAIIEILKTWPVLHTDLICICRCFGEKKAYCDPEHVEELFDLVKAAGKNCKNIHPMLIKSAIKELAKQYQEMLMNKPPENCPECGEKLEKVVQSGDSSLNRGQWEATMRGDLFCSGCGKYFFFSDGELELGYND